MGSEMCIRDRHVGSPGLLAHPAASAAAVKHLERRQVAGLVVESHKATRLQQRHHLGGLAAVGWPLVEMALQGGQTPVILTGILRPSPEGDRAWCRVLEFAEEFGISVSYEPLLLGERRGG